MTFKDKLKRRAIKSTETRAVKKFSLFDVLLAPIVTEKAYKQQESDNKYYFKAHKDANKNDIREAIKYIYKVSPKHINIINVVFKKRSQRGLVRRSYKKVIVTLDKKDKLNIVS